MPTGSSSAGHSSFWLLVSKVCCFRYPWLARELNFARALLTSELETIFAEAPLAPNSIANPRIREAHARATGKITALTPSTSSANTNRRMPGPDDDCPICYESMHGVHENTLSFCADCGNALHKECFQQCTILPSFDLPFRRPILSLSRASKHIEGWKATDLCVVPCAMGTSCWARLWAFQ
jgi:hypothetical protein